MKLVCVLSLLFMSQALAMNNADFDDFNLSGVVRVQRTLHDAAKNNDGALLTELINEGSDVDALAVGRGVTMDGMTPLFCCIVHEGTEENIDALKVLISNGADLNLRRGKRTPIHWALEQKRFASAEELIIAGANLKILGHFENTFLHCVIEENAPIRILRALLKRGLSQAVNASNVRDETPLMVAAGKCNNLKAVVVMCNAGADVALENSGGQNALEIADSYGNIKIMRALIARGATSDEMLYIASKCNAHETVKALLEAGCNVNEKRDDQGGATALHIAAEFDAFESAQVLIGAGADVNALMLSSINTPISVLALATEDSQLAALLKSAGAK